MPRAMYTIYSYVVEVRRKDTVYMVFHELYNKVYGLRLKQTQSVICALYNGKKKRRRDAKNSRYDETKSDR